MERTIEQLLSMTGGAAAAADPWSGTTRWCASCRAGGALPSSPWHDVVQGPAQHAAGVAGARSRGRRRDE